VEVLPTRVYGPLVGAVRCVSAACYFTRMTLPARLTEGTERVECADDPLNPSRWTGLSGTRREWR